MSVLLILDCALSFWFHCDYFHRALFRIVKHFIYYQHSIFNNISRKRVWLTVNSPVIASNPTCTVCSKFVGYEIFGLESLCDLLDLILFLSVFFFRSPSSGSVWNEMETRNEFIWVQSSNIGLWKSEINGSRIIASTHLLAGASGLEVDRGRFHHDYWSAGLAVPEACLRHSTLCRVDLQLSLFKFVYDSLTPGDFVVLPISLNENWFFSHVNFFSLISMFTSFFLLFLNPICFCSIRKFIVAF